MLRADSGQDWNGIALTQIKVTGAQIYNLLAAGKSNKMGRAYKSGRERQNDGLLSGGSYAPTD